MPKGYCPTCGTEIGEVTFEEQADAVDDWGVRERINDRLTTVSGDAYMEWSRKEGAHLWVPNAATGGRDYRLEEMMDFSLAEITPEQLLEERGAFTVQFQGELAVLREAYGLSAVSVHWGIIQDYI